MMVLQALFFACLVSQSSGLDKKVSCEIIRAPLSEVLSQLGKQAGVPVALAVTNRDYCSTVMVKDRPLREVLNALASVHGLSVDTESSPIRLKGTTFRSQQDSYNKMEDDLLWGETRAKMLALAALTSKPYSRDPIGAAEAKEGEPETPADWAKRRIHLWQYYMLGMWQGIEPYRDTTLPFRPIICVGFWVNRPNSKAEIEQGNAWMDANSEDLVNSQIEFFISPITGDIRLAGVSPMAAPEPCRRFPYVYASPPSALRNTPFAKTVLSWVTPPDKLDSEELRKPLKEAEPPESENWFGGQTSLATVLQSFHRQTGIDVVSDAYRISLRTSAEQASGRSGKEWIKNLVEKEGCFTRYEPRMLMVRHPGFWRLQQTEPTDASLKWLEAIAAKGRPTIPQYAEFMVANYFEMQMRFDSVSTCLTRFDPRPIKDSGPALRFIGRVPKSHKNAFLGGEPYSIDIKHEGGIATTDPIGAMLMARQAPIFGATVNGICRHLLRDGPQRLEYSRIMGYLKFVEPEATDVIRFVVLSLSQDQRSGEMRMGFNARDNIVFRLNVP